MNCSALFANDVGHRIRYRLHATHGIMHSELFFEVTNKRIHRRHMHRITANKQRVKRQSHTQLFVLYTGLGISVNRLVRAQPCELWKHFDRFPQLVHWQRHQALIADLVSRFAAAQEFFISLHIRGVYLRYLGLHRVRVRRCLKRCAIRPADFVKRKHGLQFDI